ICSVAGRWACVASDTGSARTAPVKQITVRTRVVLSLTRRMATLRIWKPSGRLLQHRLETISKIPLEHLATDKGESKKMEGSMHCWQTLVTDFEPPGL